MIATKEGKDQVSTDTGNLSDVDLLYGLRNKNESLYLRQCGRLGLWTAQSRLAKYANITLVKHPLLIENAYLLSLLPLSLPAIN
jgi:hypothetical protein